MLDLTDHVVAAALSRGAWDIGMVKCWWDSGPDDRESFEIDWDSDAGEGWALLVTGGVVKGFLWACGRRPRGRTRPPRTRPPAPP
jgi:hypothetical protein